MHAVKALIVKFVQHHQPNIVECALTDANDRVWSIVDKVAIFTGEYLDEASSYPQPGTIPCEIVREWVDADGLRRCVIDISRGRYTEAKDGETQFEVFADQIIERAS